MLDSWAIEGRGKVGRAGEGGGGRQKWYWLSAGGSGLRGEEGGNKLMSSWKATIRKLQENFELSEFRNFSIQSNTFFSVPVEDSKIKFQKLFFFLSPL